MRNRFKEWLSYNRILQMILATAAVVLCCIVWSKRVFWHVSVSKGNEAPLQYTGEVTMDKVVMQQFSPQKEDLEKIVVRCKVENIKYDDRVFVTIFDEEYRQVCQEVARFNEIEEAGAIVMYPQAKLTAGKNYMLGLNAHYENEGTLQVAYGEAGSMAIPECDFFYYDAVPYTNMQLKMEFRYATSYYSWLRVAGRMAAVLFGAVGIWALSVWGKLFLERKKWYYRVKYATVMSLFILVGALEIVCAWYMCVKKYFGGEWLDIVVYALCAVTVFALTAYAFYRAFFGRDAWIRRESVNQKPYEWRNYFQIVCMTILIWGGIYYINAEVQWKQDYARSWVFLMFGLFVLFTLPARSLLHWIDFVWAAVMLPLGIAWCRVSSGAHQEKITRCHAAGAFVWGIVLIYLLRNWKKQKSQSWNIPLCACWALMCLLMIVNSHGKTWPVFLVVTFTLFYLVPYTENERKQVMHNFVLGVFANFFWMLGESLCHRPFHNYAFYRYPMYFFTVGCTGMYLTMVEAAVLAALLQKIRKTGKVWHGAWKEWAFSGLVLGFVNLTIARTSYLAVAAMIAVLLAAAIWVYRPRVKRILLAGAIFAGTTFLALPTGYTLARCVPAVVNRPVQLSVYEDFKETIRRGEKPDSRRYRGVRRELGVWFERMGMPKVSKKLLSDNGIVNRPYGRPSMAAAVVPLYISLESVPTDDMITNGRLEIFREYLKGLNLTGHADMGIMMEDGHEASHAHNTFLQNAHDFGILAGILYLGIVLGMIGRSLYLMKTGKDRSTMQLVVLMILCALAAVSVSEYCANPSYPLGFASFFVLFTMRREKNVVQ